MHCFISNNTVANPLIIRTLIANNIATVNLLFYIKSTMIIIILFNRRNFVFQITHCNVLYNVNYLTIVLCEYSKFRIESNSYFNIQFDSKQAQLFKIFEYLPSPISYSFNRMTSIFHLATTPSNQQNLLLTMVQVLYLPEVFILVHYYGPPSTETPTTTIVQCHKNS